MPLDIKKISVYLHVASFLILVDTLHLLNVSSSFMTHIFVSHHRVYLCNSFYEELKQKKKNKEDKEM